MVEKLGPEEFIAVWDNTIDKMVRFHDNISTELQQLIITIKNTMDGEGTKLVPTAEEKATFGKVYLNTVIPSALKKLMFYIIFNKILLIF